MTQTLSTGNSGIQELQITRDLWAIRLKISLVILLVGIVVVAVAIMEILNEVCLIVGSIVVVLAAICLIVFLVMLRAARSDLRIAKET